MNTISYRNLHFPSSIIQYAIWLYARFNLSLRDGEELLAERGIEVSYETIRRWVIRFSEPLGIGWTESRHPASYRLVNAHGCQARAPYGEATGRHP